MSRIDRRVSAARIAADLALARGEIATLRQSRDRLQEDVCRQLDQVSNRQLTERIAELTTANHSLEKEAAEACTLRKQVQQLDADLAAAWTSLRNMIRAENGGS